MHFDRLVIALVAAALCLPSIAAAAGTPATGPTVLAPLAPSVCTTFTNCSTCAASPQCGFCMSSGTCEDGTASGPTGGGSCPSLAWIFTKAECTSDACRAYSTSCSACSSADPMLDCGWCQDSQICATGSASGPLAPVTCLASTWTWEACGPAASCALATTCSTCLSQAYSSCGWCAATQTCSLGDVDGPFTSHASGSCPNNWMFNDDLSTSTLQCYQPTPFNHVQASMSTVDWASLGSLGFLALAVLTLTLWFSPLCCRSWVPQPGELNAADKIHPEEDIDGDEQDDDEVEAEAEVSSRACLLNRCCSKFFLWLACLVLLGLSVASLTLDFWSYSLQDSAQLAADDNPLLTVEGLLSTSLWLGHNHHSKSTYTYDCDRIRDQPAQVECQIHTYAGIATLVLGSLSAFASFSLALMASANLCCAARYTPAARFNPLHQSRIRYPFKVAQWRCAAWASIFGMASCGVFGVGCFLLSQQYFASSMYLSISFMLMLAEAVLAAVVALLYRRAIRATPKGGYPLGGEDGVGHLADRDRADSAFAHAAPLNSALGYPGSQRKKKAASAPPDEDQQAHAYTYHSFHGGQQPLPPPDYHRMPTVTAAAAAYTPPVYTPPSTSPYTPMPPAAQAARFAASQPPTGAEGTLGSSAFTQVPWQAYVGEAHSLQSTYMPPPGFVLVPASQASQYLSPQRPRLDSSVSDLGSLASTPRTHAPFEPHHHPGLVTSHSSHSIMRRAESMPLEGQK